MRWVCGVFLLIAGCSGVAGRQPSGVVSTQSETLPPGGCVQIGGGELQEGLTLGLGGGDVIVTGVERVGNAPVGFSVTGTAPDRFFIVTAGNVSCSDGDSYLSAQPITRIDFCAGVSGCI